MITVRVVNRQQLDGCFIAELPNGRFVGLVGDLCSEGESVSVNLPNKFSSQSVLHVAHQLLMDGLDQLMACGAYPALRSDEEQEEGEKPLTFDQKSDLIDDFLRTTGYTPIEAPETAIDHYLNKEHLTGPLSKPVVDFLTAHKRPAAAVAVLGQKADYTESHGFLQSLCITSFINLSDYQALLRNLQDRIDWLEASVEHDKLPPVYDRLVARRDELTACQDGCYQLTLEGYDPNDDHADYLVRWVNAPSLLAVLLFAERNETVLQEAPNYLGQRRTRNAGADLDIDAEGRVVKVLW